MDTLPTELLEVIIGQVGTSQDDYSVFKAHLTSTDHGPASSEEIM